MKRILVLLTVVLVASVARAETTLPSIFGDHMVVQRAQPVVVWGADEPGTRITAALGDGAGQAIADADGRWRLELPPMAAGGPHRLLVDGTTKVMFEDVLVGEVWLCSGQSNMEWTVQGSANADTEIAAADHPRIRHIKIPHRPAATPQSDVDAEPWQPCTPEAAGAFTGVGYFFARELQRELDVPIGLIGCNWGGTRVEPWTTPAGFDAVPALTSIAIDMNKYPERRDDGQVHHQSPTALYNGMISPLVPYGIRGALWYQGESNNGEGMLYHEKMKALIAGWRTLWGRDDLPFYYVQLAPFRYRGEPDRLPAIWEAQLETLTVPHTGMAVTVDIGNVDDIHPRNKQDVGRRLALWALAKTYGRDELVHSGPLYRSMTVEDGAVRLAFDHVGGGLVSRDGAPLSWFTIAGEDGQFVEATAEIDGDTVIVRADSVPAPVAVRLGWHQEAQPNLSNREGLPASPFRTDGE